MHKRDEQLNEICTILGLTAQFGFNDMVTINAGSQRIGTMTTTAWLDHLRHCLIKTKRC